jgi:hypothetical protein
METFRRKVYTMTARPSDLMLAYDEDFTGFTSLDRMARPVESTASMVAGATLTVGGSNSSDGYYEDFTSRLDRFVRENPRLGSFTAGSLEEMDSLQRAAPEERFVLADYVHGPEEQLSDYIHGSSEIEPFSLSDYLRESDGGCPSCLVGGDGLFDATDSLAEDSYSSEFDADPQFDGGWESSEDDSYEKLDTSLKNYDVDGAEVLGGDDPAEIDGNGDEHERDFDINLSVVDL